MYNKNDKWDVLGIILNAQDKDKEKEHEDWLCELSEEEFEEHLRRCHLAKTLQRKAG